MMQNFRLSRRSVLRGLGVTMALPWLESLPAWADDAVPGAAANRPPVRMAVLFSGNGFHSKEWWAKGEGRNMELGKVLAPLHDFRERLLFIRGLYNEEAQKGNIHSSQTGNLLSGAPLASGGVIRSGTSLDQIVAQRMAACHEGAEPSAGLRDVERLGPQELLDAVQLAHFVDVADHAHAARAVSGAGLRSAVQGRSGSRRRKRAGCRAGGRPRRAPRDQQDRPAQTGRIPGQRARSRAADRAGGQGGASRGLAPHA